MMICIWN